jgi:hypothetical protein
MAVCKLPEGTTVHFPADVELLDGVDSQSREHGLWANAGLFTIVIHGLSPTDDIGKQLMEARAHGPAEDPTTRKTINVPANTTIGTVGYPLEHDWGMEGCNLVVRFPAIPEMSDVVESCLKDILDSVLVATSASPVAASPVRFSKPGLAESDVRVSDATIVCEMPEGTRVTLGINVALQEIKWSRDVEGQREYCLFADAGSYGLFFLGVTPTDEIVEQLGPTHIVGLDEDPETIKFIEVPAGTTIGTVGHPLVNDWGEGCNMVIIVSTYPETAYTIKPAVEFILEAVRQP